MNSTVWSRGTAYKANASVEVTSSASLRPAPYLGSDFPMQHVAANLSRRLDRARLLNAGLQRGKGLLWACQNATRNF